MVVPSCCDVSGNLLVVIVAILYDLIRWVFMKFLVQSKVILNLFFVESFRTLGVQHSKMPLMIDWIIGAKRPCLTSCMFFNTLMSSSFNFGFVSKIEKCVRKETIPLAITSFKCGLSSPLSVSYS